MPKLAMVQSSFNKIFHLENSWLLLSNGTIIILTVTVVFNEIPFILVHGVKVKE